MFYVINYVLAVSNVVCLGHNLNEWFLRSYDARCMGSGYTLHNNVNAFGLYLRILQLQLLNFTFRRMSIHKQDLQSFFMGEQKLIKMFRPQKSFTSSYFILYLAL